MKALRISLILFLFLIYCSNLSAQSPFQFLRYVSGARAAGLSGAFVSMTNDATALFFNPATISTVEEKPASVTRSEERRGGKECSSRGSPYH